MIPVSTCRAQFPSAEQRIHLDHAGVSPIPVCVADAIRTFVDESVSRLSQRYPYWELRAEEIRQSCALLSGAEARQVAFVKNTSEALSFVAGGLDWAEGDIVVAVDEEFPSNVYPWWDLARLGVETRMVAPTAVLGDLRVLEDALEGPVRVLAVSAVAYGTGDLRPLADLATLCRSRDVLLVVDGIQALGAVRVDLAAEGLDCIAADGHKWMCAPEGAGFMALSDRLLDRLRPIEFGWKSVVESGRFYPYEFKVRSDAAKFEAGSLGLMGIHGLGAAVDLVLEVGLDEIENRLGALTNAFAEGFRSRGCDVLGARATASSTDRRSGILTFVPKADPERLRQELWARDVMCKARFGGLRVAPHHYQDERDVSEFFERLDDAERELA